MNTNQIEDGYGEADLQIRSSLRQEAKPASTPRQREAWARVQAERQAQSAPVGRRSLFEKLFCKPPETAVPADQSE